MPFARAGILREFKLGTDTWLAGDLTFRTFSPVAPIPEPGVSSRRALQLALVPAVLAELTLDNTQGTLAALGFFWLLRQRSVQQPAAARRYAGGTPVSGKAGLTAIVSADAGVRSGMGFGIEGIIAPPIPENTVFGLGGVAALTFTSRWGRK